MFRVITLQNNKFWQSDNLVLHINQGFTVVWNIWTKTDGRNLLIMPCCTLFQINQNRDGRFLQLGNSLCVGVYQLSPTCQLFFRDVPWVFRVQLYVYETIQTEDAEQSSDNGKITWEEAKRNTAPARATTPNTTKLASGLSCKTAVVFGGFSFGCAAAFWTLTGAGATAGEEAEELAAAAVDEARLLAAFFFLLFKFSVLT